jgi:hypothetical protein
MQAMKGSNTKLDISKPGKTTVVIHYGPQSEARPNGGTLNRMEKILIHPTETWDSVVNRLLDHWDKTHAAIETVKASE